MNKAEMEAKIKKAVTQLKPNDAYVKISREIENISQERKIIKMKERNISIKKISFAVVAACLVLVAGIFGFSYYSNNIAVDSIIDIDVNPSIEIKANKNDKVLEVVAINDDGVQILDGMDLKNAELKVAVNAVIGSMVKKGYFSELDSGILVSVENKNEAKAERIRKEIVQDIDAQFEQNNILAPVINQAVDPSHSDDADKFAAEHKISYGKALFILNLVKKDASLNADALAKLDIYEIAKLVRGRENKELVEIFRSNIDELSYIGNVSAFSQQLLVFGNFVDFFFDGYRIIRCKDVTEIATKEKNDALLFMDKICKKEELKLERCPFADKIKSWSTFFDYLISSKKAITLECSFEDATDYYVGWITQLNSNIATMQCFDGSGIMFKDKVKVNLDFVTAVTVGDRYTSYMSKYVSK